MLSFLHLPSVPHIKAHWEGALMCELCFIRILVLPQKRYLCAQFGDELKPLGHEEVLGERLGEIALRPKEFADQSYGSFGDGTLIIDIPWRQPARSRRTKQFEYIHQQNHAFG